MKNLLKEQYTYSEKITTKQELKAEIKKMKTDICKLAGVQRNQIRIPNGLIVLLKNYDGVYLPQTSTIYEMEANVKNNSGEFMLRRSANLKFNKKN